MNPVDELRQSRAHVQKHLYKPHYTQTISKFAFYFHLVIVLFYCSVVISLHPFIITRTLTFALVVIYGFMLIWMMLIHMALFCCNQIGASTIVLRVIVKIAIALWPIIGTYAYFKENYLYLRELKWWMYYMTIFSVAYVFFQLIAFCCFDKSYAGWVYKVQRAELKDIKNLVVERRNEFFRNNPHST